MQLGFWQDPPRATLGDRVRFYLGTHQPHWLSTLTVPLFVSRRRLAGRRSLPRAAGRWALDSGGFSELSMYGRWTVTAREYAGEVRRFRDEIGGIDWAAPQDWMCEPWITKKTGYNVRKHQALTVWNLLNLRHLAPDLPWAPVLQGWTLGDYLDHAEEYTRAGVDLTAEPIVGVGSVCRRQGTFSAGMILDALASLGLRLHGFGFKIQGLLQHHRHLVSADSLAWSFDARRSPPLPGHDARHKNCANCETWALNWYRDLMGRSVR